MSRPLSSGRLFRRPLFTPLLIAVLAGLAVVALTGMALAKSFTLGGTKNVKVTNSSGVTKRETVVVNTHGIAVYDLVPETVHHALCTKANGCFQFWFPVKVSSKAKLTKAPGVKGKLGVWHRNGFAQLTLGGHPLYTFIGDNGKKGIATGDTIASFNGIWHVIKSASAGKATRQPASTTTTPTPGYPPGW